MRKLETNPNHKRVGKINKPLISFFCATGIIIGMYIGTEIRMKQEKIVEKYIEAVMNDEPIPYSKEEAEKYSSPKYQEAVEIPNEYFLSVIREIPITRSTHIQIDAPISQGDLEEMKKIELIINNDASLEFLGYCTNLKQVDLTITTSGAKFIENLPVIHGVKKLNICLVDGLYDETIEKTIQTKFPDIKRPKITIKQNNNEESINEKTR